MIGTPLALAESEERVQFQVTCFINASVKAVVPGTVRLEDDAVAQRLVAEGRDAGIRQCRVSAPGAVEIFLRRASTSPGNSDVRASFYVTPQGLQLASYENSAKAEWERAQAAQKRAEAERERAETCARPETAKTAISRTVEGFSLGATKDSVMRKIDAGWGKEYLLPQGNIPWGIGISAELRLPSWRANLPDDPLSLVTPYRKAPKPRRYPLNVAPMLSEELIEFRTDSTNFVILAFYAGKLYRIRVEPIDVHQRWKEAWRAIVEKYGPTYCDDSALLEDLAIWRDPATSLAVSKDHLGDVTRSLPPRSFMLIYTDLGATERIKRDRATAEEEARREREKPRPMPKGY
jgi:hypothetical protein